MTEAVATPTPEATTSQAPPPASTTPKEQASPPAPEGAGEGASGAEAKKGEAAAPAEAAVETPEQRQKRVEAAGKRARREAARNRELMAQIAQQRDELTRAQGAQRELERLEALKKDKWAAARELGIDPRELAEQALKEGTPEYQQAQEIAEAKREAREAKEALARFLEEQQRSQITQQHRAAQADFLKATETHPDVRKLPAEVRLTWADQIIRQARAEAEQRGLDWRKVAPTDARIAAYMQKSLSGVPAVPAKAPDTESAPDAKPNGSASPQTVTSKVASQKFTPPANWDDLSDEQQKRIFAQALEQAAIRK